MLGGNSRIISTEIATRHADRTARSAGGDLPEQQYVARRGDQLSGIAQRFRIPLPF